MARPLQNPYDPRTRTVPCNADIETANDILEADERPNAEEVYFLLKFCPNARNGLPPFAEQLANHRKAVAEAKAAAKLAALETPPSSGKKMRRTMRAH
jgi:hypothetical protein